MWAECPSARGHQSLSNSNGHVSWSWVYLHKLITLDISGVQWGRQRHWMYPHHTHPLAPIMGWATLLLPWLQLWQNLLNLLLVLAGKCGRLYCCCLSQCNCFLDILRGPFAFTFRFFLAFLLGIPLNLSVDRSIFIVVFDIIFWMVSILT